MGSRHDVAHVPATLLRASRTLHLALVASEGPPVVLTEWEGAVYYGNITHEKNCKVPSSSLNSISLASGNEGGSDLGHYSAEFIILGLRVLSVSGGLSGFVAIILREGAQPERFGRWPRRRLVSNLHGD